MDPNDGQTAMSPLPIMQRSWSHGAERRISGFRRTLRGAALLILAAFTSPAPAVEFFDYGFAPVDNSAGGSVLDGYVSQQFWAETDLLLLGAQLRIELEAGSLFQDSVGGSGFSFGPPHEILVEQQPSLAFDTCVGINGAQPGIVAGGAVNLGGQPGASLDSSGMNLTWSSGPGNLQSGRFDLAMITLSGDAVGRGAILLSGNERGRDGRKEIFAHVFEIQAGEIRFTDQPVPSYDGNHVMLDRNFEPVVPPQREPPSPPSQAEPPVEAPPPLPEPELPSPNEVVLPPVFDPEPLIHPQPLPGDRQSDPVAPGAQQESPEADSILYPITHFRPDFDFEDLVIYLDDAVIDEPYADMLRLPPDAVLLFDEIAASAGDVALDENDLMVLRALDGTKSSLLTARYGALALPLSSLTEADVAELVSTGNWSVRGASLVFSAGGGVPEPSSVVLAGILAAGTLGWRWRRLIANPRRR